MSDFNLWGTPKAWVTLNYSLLLACLMIKLTQKKGGIFELEIE